VLFHGTFLYAFDLPLISALLHAPSRQPEYRAAREHSAFITNIPATPEQLKETLTNAWQANGALELPQAAVTALARERYESRQWNTDRESP
jgi:lipoate-protein ligase A